MFYATSNRRHLLPRDMMENERSTAINPHEAVEEKVSLSDRFGLWLGFHKCSQEDYLAMVHGYAAHFGLDVDEATLDRDALEWATTRGARSGRVAWQFITDLAGRLGVPIAGLTAPAVSASGGAMRPRSAAAVAARTRKVNHALSLPRHRRPRALRRLHRGGASRAHRRVARL